MSLNNFKYVNVVECLKCIDSTPLKWMALSRRTRNSPTTPLTSDSVLKGEIVELCTLTKTYIITNLNTKTHQVVDPASSRAHHSPAPSRILILIYQYFSRTSTWFIWFSLVHCHIYRLIFSAYWQRSPELPMPSDNNGFNLIIIHPEPQRKRTHSVYILIYSPACSLIYLNIDASGSSHAQL